MPHYSNPISKVTAWSLGSDTRHMRAWAGAVMTDLPAVTVTVLMGAGAVSMIACSLPDRRVTTMRPGCQWSDSTLICPRHSAPSSVPVGHSFGTAGSNFTSPGEDSTSILSTTDGRPPLMSMLNIHPGLCIEARLLSQ